MTIILCACGCGKPRREISKYATENCGHRHRRAASKAGQSLKSLKQCANSGCQNMTHFKFCGTKCSSAFFHVKNRKTIHIHGRGVTVTDPLVATPYTIPRGEWDTYAADYIALGCSAEIDGGQMEML